MLAIIIPFYKLTFFEATLQSLANQTDKRFKVYIGDDASPEDCTSLLKRFDGRFDFTYHRFETNLGGTSLTKQWERCIDLITDDTVQWIMILGDDDILDSTVVENFHKHYTIFYQKSKVVRFATKVLDQIENKNSNLFINPKFEKGYEYIERKINGLTRGSLSEFVFYKQDLKRNGITDYSSAFYSDDKLVLDLSFNNFIYSINDSVVQIRIFYESLSGKSQTNYDKLASARFSFFSFLIKNYYNVLNLKSKILIIDFLIGYGLKYDKLKSYDLLYIYAKVLLLFNMNFLKKSTKKILKKKLLL